MTEKYRKIHVYTKSLHQWYTEKARRRAILTLFREGVSQTEISARLGISRKTVQRDLKKLHSYITRLDNQRDWKMQEMFQQAFNQLPEKLQINVAFSSMRMDSKTKFDLWIAVLRHDIPELRRLIRRGRRN